MKRGQLIKRPSVDDTNVMTLLEKTCESEKTLWLMWGHWSPQVHV